MNLYDAWLALSQIPGRPEYNSDLARRARMTWNHRVMRRRWPSGEVTYEIHEAYYTTEGALEGYTTDPVAPIGSADEVFDDLATGDKLGLAGLRWTLEQMLAALDKPILDYEDTEEPEP